MPRYICKLEDRYFEWSTVVDAPVTGTGTLDEFRAYYRDQYGESGMRDLDERLTRVEATGTSAHGYESVEDLLEHNRFGPGESHVSLADLRRWARGEWEPEPRGEKA